MLAALLKKQTGNFFIQLFRYVLAGGVAFVVDISTLLILTEVFKFYYLLSAFFAFGLGLFVSYTLSIRWIFNRRTLENQKYEMGVFVFIGLVGLGLTEAILWFFTEQVHLHYFNSKLIATVIVFVWNFLSRKFILFR